MLCINLKGRVRNCGSVTGGVSDVAIFDPSDYDFTQAAPIAGAKQPYSAIALRPGATSAGGAKMYTINFQQDEGELTKKQSKKGCATKYEFEWILQLPEDEQGLATFLESLDAAGCCCGLGVITRYNSGKIFVAGEKFVNGNSIPRFTVAQDGSEGSSGKLFDDFNGVNLHMKGSYNRPLYEYSGTWASIEALITGAPLTFDTLLSFAASTTPSGAGVSGTVTVVDADQSFEFNAISPRTGTPQSMNIRVASVLEAVIDFPTDYLGQPFNYTDKLGVEHAGVFAGGNVNF